MARKTIFEPFFLFLGDFFPIFRVRPKSIFRRFFSDFGPKARNRHSPRHTYSQASMPNDCTTIGLHLHFIPWRSGLFPFSSRSESRTVSNTTLASPGLQSESCANFASWRCESQCEFLSEFRCEFLRSAAAFLSGVAPANQTKERAKNEKFMNFSHFCEFWCFCLGKQARFTLNFCSGMPPGKVYELAFLWFGLPGPLLILGRFK